MNAFLSVGLLSLALIGVLLPCREVQFATQVKPIFVEDELLLRLVENPANPEAVSLDDLYEATGVTKIEGPPGDGTNEVVAHVQLKPGRRFGATFRALQHFDFGPQPRWSLDLMQPNYIE